jgi:Xaa-Pro aminopeptidase
MARFGTACRSLQRRVCERFEAAGHPTVWHTPQTETGYVHSLGHGVGLDIHERPLLSDAEGNTDTLAPGMVFTIEPGLYYPEHGLGVRLEDTCWMDSNGVTQVIAPFPLDLILPAKQRAGSRKPIRKKASEPASGKKPRTPKTKR